MEKKLNCIMLIDDDFATNLYHEIIIKELDCVEHLIILDGAEKALEYLKSPASADHPKPDLIFLDINMPRMTGWDFLSEYENLSDSQRSGNIVVMLSTSSHPDDLRRAEENPFVKEYQSKPITDQMLLELIERYYQTIDMPN
ncbi:MAG: response regulator [Bacteroidota bacterium]